MQSGVLAEAVGLSSLQKNDPASAAQWFRTAKTRYTATEDKMRQDFHQIAIDRAAKRKDLAVQGLRAAQLSYGSLPEADALRGWLDILDPPPPPVADPTKPTAVATP